MRVARWVEAAALVAALGLASAGCGSTPARPGPTIVEPSPPAVGSPARPSTIPSALLTLPPPTPVAGAGPWITGYYAGYERDAYPIAEIDWTSLSDVAVAFILPRPDGSLDAGLFLDPDEGPVLARALVDAAHRHGRRAIASVGGAGMRDAWLSATSITNRARFVTTLSELLSDYGYDGLDLDWEPVEAGDGPIILDLARRLRAAAPTTLLTMPVDPVNSNLPGELSAYGELGEVLDRLNLMSYGMAGTYEGWQSWHSSALRGESPTTPTSVDASVRAYLAAGVPKARLGVGAGFYGLCYSPPVSAPGQELDGAAIVADDGRMSFSRIVGTYLRAADRQWDGNASVPYLSFERATGPDGCGYVSYEDAQSLDAKARYVTANGLGGVIAWTINQGYVDTEPTGRRNPLLAALRGALGP